MASLWFAWEGGITQNSSWLGYHQTRKPASHHSNIMEKRKGPQESNEDLFKQFSFLKLTVTLFAPVQLLKSPQVQGEEKCIITNKIPEVA